MFRLVTNGSLQYYTIDSFSATGRVKHCFTTRRGGVSSGCWKSMNLRVNSGDSRENILENYGIICGELGIDRERLVLSKQVHKTDIIDITAADCGNGLMLENKFESADALVTAETGVPLVTFYADCVPVFLLDKVKGVIALVHSGWKGTAGNIAALTAEHMKNEYHSRAEDIIAAIGPSIRACHFEVGEEVAEHFDGKYIIGGYDKPHIDLQGCIRGQLESVGVKDITDSGICTYCNNDMFYSHRRTGDSRGTMAAIMQLL